MSAPVNEGSETNSEHISTSNMSSDDATLTFVVYLLGGSVVALCLIMKVPQIIAVVKSGTTKGLSLTSLMLEMWAFTILFCYQFANEYPLSAYVEYSMLLIQDMILLLILLNDQGHLNILTIAAFGIYFAGSTAISMGMLPSSIMYMLISSVTPLAASSKLIQLRQIIVNRDPGPISAVTWGIATYTASVRIFTTLVQTGDVAMLITIGTAASLNCAMLISILYYRKQKKTKMY
ncbi:unnamed protein product [Owenia fusiformis]|uniref:Uncharacterized protein n=1 Tax=Owenia fusiformis TaxID=6347 RepID=A0A8J1UDS5_OWEFU|nr:unnamed protein product [Owenia fusiformis]